MWSSRTRDRTRVSYILADGFLATEPPGKPYPPVVNFSLLGYLVNVLCIQWGFLSLAGGNSNELWSWVGLPWWLVGKESTCIVGDLGLIPELGRSPGEGTGYPLQYSGLENSMDRGAWQATVHGVAKSWTGLSDFHFHWPYGSSGNCLFYHSNSSFYGSCSWSSLLKIGLCSPYALQVGIQPNT